MPAPRVRAYQKPKKGTIKRLMKSLWKHFKLELILVLVTLILSIAVNLCGSVFASLITEVLTKAIPSHTVDPSVSILTDYFEVNLLNFIPFKTNLTSLVIALASIYGVGVICSWAWNRTMAVITQKYLNLFRIKMFSHMQKLPSA